MSADQWMLVILAVSHSTVALIAYMIGRDVHVDEHLGRRWE